MIALVHLNCKILSHSSFCGWNWIYIYTLIDYIILRNDLWYAMEEEGGGVSPRPTTPQRIMGIM